MFPTQLIAAVRSAARFAVPACMLGLIILQGCCCAHRRGNACNSCGGAPVYDYGAGYGAAPSFAPPAGGCPDGNCGAYPTGYATGTNLQAGLPPATLTATAPVYAPGFAPAPMTAAVQPLPTH